MVGIGASAPLPTLQITKCAKRSPAIRKRENINGQEEAEITGRGEISRAEKITRAQSRKKTVAKSTARKKLKAGGREVPVKRARPKQRIAISHYRDEDFKPDGLRTYAHYRDLGIAGCDPWPGAGACDPPDRAVQSGGGFKAAFPRSSNSRWSMC